MMCCNPNRAGVQRALVGMSEPDKDTGYGDAGQLPRDELFSTFLAATFCNPLPGLVAKNQHCLQAWTAWIGSCSYLPDGKEAPK